MATHPDVLVVGGGVIGLTSAYLLAKSGLRVEVVDKGELGREASWAGAGILPPWGDGEYATPLDRLRAYSVSRFAGLSAELRELTGIDNEYHVCGGVEFLDEADADVPDLWRREGVRFERSQTGYRLPFAQVRNPRHVKALADACRQVGVTLTPNTPIGLICPGFSDAVSGCFSGSRYFGAGEYLITSGAWAGESLRFHLEVETGIRPVRGQMALLNPDRPGLRHILIAGKRYLVPRRDGRVLVGSTEEPEAGFDKGNTSHAVAGLIEFARHHDSELAGAPVEATWSGLRPGTPDGLPYIGRVPGFDNVIVAAGHFRAGIQTSIGTAESVRALLLGEPPPVPLDAFAVGRTPHPPMRTAFRS